MKQIYLSVFFIILCTNIVFTQSNIVQFEHLSVKDGLSQLSVISIFQDSQGFMWFGTRDGLNRYDGYNFQIFRESDRDNYISNGHIQCMVDDGKNRLWVGTRNGLNRFNPNTGKFVQFFHTDNDSTISNNNIICMLKDYRGVFWLGTANGLNRHLPDSDSFELCTFDGLLQDLTIYALAEDHDENLWIGTSEGLFVYNPHIMSIHAYKHDIKNEHSIAQNRIAALFCDSKGRIWIGFHQHGVCLYDGENNSFIRFSKEEGLNDNTIRCFEEDKEKNILVGTFDGLCFYDERSKKFTSAYNSGNNDIASMSNFSVYAILCDRAGTVWIGTYSGGVNYYNPCSQRFRFHDPGKQGQVVFGIIGPIIEHTTGIWLGTEGGGLLFFNKKDGSYTYYNLPSASQQSFSRNIVKSLLLNDDFLWLGSTHNTLYRFDIKTRQFDQTLSPSWGNIQYALLKDSDKKFFWIGSSGGNAFGYIDSKGQSVQPLLLNNGEEFNPSDIRCILEDSKGSIFLGSYSAGLFHYDSNAKTQIQYSHRENDTTSLSFNRVTSICKTKQGEIWVSTLGGGISRLNLITRQFDNFGKRYGLASESVYALVADCDDKLWLSTASGISQFDPVSKKFSNYEKNNGIRISEFTPGSGFVTTGNEIFFGGNNGFVSFYPSHIKTNYFVPPIHITNVLVNNEPLEKTIASGDHIRLNHQQSNITIEFSALNYVFPNQNQYAYKLEGFDKEWNYGGYRRTAYYTNIQPGSYTFRVKGANNDGIWNEMGASLSVFITPPPWNTWWSWLLYIMAATSGIIYVTHLLRIRTKLKNNILIKQIERENMEELHQTKIKLFTNFSHELLTPLTLILTPLEDILLNNELMPKLRETLQLMHKNTRRLLYTVNQLMDFRKKESGHLQLKASQGNIVKFSNEIYIAFNELAHLRNIDFQFVCGIDLLHLWYDRDLLEKVLFNLLSNAFKNTPSGGKIVFALSFLNKIELHSNYPHKANQLPQVDDFLLISVRDTGPGIPQAELEKIFDPFYQAHQKEITQPLGTGIGLNLSKGVIDLHQGAIWADNYPGEGAIFCVILPVGNSHFKESDLEPDYKNSEDSSHYPVTDMLEATQLSFVEPDEKPVHSILIVEDNADVRHYIHLHLGKYYTVYEAKNGKEAFDIAVEQLPDLIISDIMMPIMDGIELCHMLKNDLRTGHIPVILLTARTTVLQVQEGFEIGADEYVTKPFNAGLLITRIRNLISSREKLRDLFGQKSSLAFPELPTSSIDSRFMDSIYKYINDHLTDSNLNMDDFCKEIGMSRSNFYRKIKTISDLNPNELIRITRMRNAAKYIHETNLSISEIAYKVGFSSPSYFTKTFSAFYKMSPSKMKEEKIEANRTVH